MTDFTLIRSVDFQDHTLLMSSKPLVTKEFYNY